MCPTCFANMAVMVFGLTSIGGLTAFTRNQDTNRKEQAEQRDKNLPDQKEKNMAKLRLEGP